MMYALRFVVPLVLVVAVLEAAVIANAKLA